MPAKTKKEDVQKWLEENFSHIELIEWGGSSTRISVFKDKSKDRTFKKSFSYVKNSLIRFPDISFVLTKEEKNEKIKKSNIEKYGHVAPSLNFEIKEKIKKTNIERYGSPCPLSNQEIFIKRKNTWEVKYGCDHPWKSKEIQAKIRQTNVERYGVEYFSKTDYFKDWFKKYSFEKWGVNNPAQDKDIKEKILKSKNIIRIDDKTIKEWSQNQSLGSINSIYVAVRKGFHPTQVFKKKYFAENKIKDLILDAGYKENIDFFHNKKLPEHKGRRSEYKRPDFLFPRIRLIVEVEGDEIHGNPRLYGPHDLIGFKRNIPAAKKWESDKKRNLTYTDNKYVVLTIWEYDVKNDLEKIKEKMLSTIINLEDF